MQKRPLHIILFAFVLIAYLVLVGITIYSYNNADDDLPGDLPEFVILIPAVMTLMVPATYGLLMFAVAENHRPGSTTLLGLLMGLGMLGLSIAVYAFST